MAIRAFSIEDRGGLRRAVATDLPDVVVIAGPNGIGKSTLLFSLWEQRGTFAEPGTDVTYIGPHRPWKKSQLSSAALSQLPYSFGQLLGMPNFPGWDQFAPPGLQAIGQQPREPQGADEALSLLKFSIAKLEMRRLRVLGAEFDRQGSQIAAGTLGDIYKPLKDLTRYLLSHLEFDHVDFEVDRDVKCLFRRVDADYSAVVDIDNLSSGEKAILALFFPFLERQIASLLGDDLGDPDRPMSTTLIDEPEIHLHPTLQASLVEYMRRLATERVTQFIVTTHSPTLLDALDQDEFFMLAPSAFVADGNQFVRVSSSPERLEAIRDLTGSSHLVTRCRPVVFVEGERPGASPAVTDQRLLESLLPVAASWVVVPTRGRAQAVGSATSLRAAAADGLPGVPVFALVDADQRLKEDPDYVISWPVAMIENLLLDREAIWTVLAPQREVVRLGSADEVGAVLLEIASARRDDEIRLRVSWLGKPIRPSVDFEPPFDPAEWRTRVLSATEADLEGLGSDEALQEDVAKAEADVRGIEESGRQLEAFRGKEIFRTFFDLHAKAAGLSYPAFAYAVAAEARASARVAALADGAARQIQSYVPVGLSPALRDLADALPAGEERAAAEAAVVRVDVAREEWESSSPVTVSRVDLRADMSRFARVAEANGLGELRRRILTELVQLGLGADGD
jgi:putative AbiEii toxin of type IV toxin-antitoxin system